MATETISAPAGQVAKRPFASTTLGRVLRYSLVRLVTLIVTVIIGVYLTILIANMGGYVGTIMRNEIRDRTAQSMRANPSFQQLTPEARQKLIEDKIRLEEQRLGLDQPFALRSFNFLRNALTLNLGRAIHMNSDSGSRQVRLILLERLPATLLLTGTSNVALFFASIFIALALS